MSLKYEKIMERCVAGSGHEWTQYCEPFDGECEQTPVSGSFIQYHAIDNTRPTSSLHPSKLFWKLNNFYQRFGHRLSTIELLSSFSVF